MPEMSKTDQTREVTLTLVADSKSYYFIITTYVFQAGKNVNIIYKIHATCSNYTPST